MKEDLMDTTFIIPIRLDSIIRLENLQLIINFLLHNFNTNIIVLEAAYYKNGMIDRMLNGKGEYIFIEDKDPVFHRTKYINLMLKKTRTKIVANWDCDIIAIPKQIIDSIKAIRSGIYDIAYPYNGICLDTSDIIRYLYFVNEDLKVLLSNMGKMRNMYLAKNTGAVGGAVIASTEKYINSGMENESFYGWGLEDSERFYRWKNLGYAIYRSKGCIFHFTHPRYSNSEFCSDYQRDKSIKIVSDLIELSEIGKR